MLTMALFLRFIPLLYLSFNFFSCIASNPTPQHYIVYMGSSRKGKGGEDLSHLQILSYLNPSEESDRSSVVLNSYSHAFKGFSAMLTENEVSTLSNHDEVVSIFPDPILNLHTTRSWDFLESVDSNFKSRSRLSNKGHSSDVIIGIIDTGIWPESPSFSDQGIGRIPSKWKGECMESRDFKKSDCNRKLIGARFYRDSSNETQTSPRDTIGHGTHTASTAGGSPVADASFYGLARGVARGGLPSARIASYKACNEEGCSGSVILRAIDDAIRDGVDMISISIGTTAGLRRDFLSDPIAIGAFHAEQMGIPVVCSAGNNGPAPNTVVNTAPWILTVAASTIDREFHSTIVLGNNETYKGTAINFSPLTRRARYPLAFGRNVAADMSPASEARTCFPGSLDPNKAAGKIVVCTDGEPTVSRSLKMLAAQSAGAIGVIMVSRRYRTPMDVGTYPFVEVRGTAASRILDYINTNNNPSATILATTVTNGFKPAPVVAPFSSRGPGSLTEFILKPDIMAPGVSILAAVPPIIEPDYGAPGNRSSPFAIRSGTSMSCPHVTGAMAFLKSVHPYWSSSVLKSALITTASFSHNNGASLTNTTSYRYAALHETGAGEVQPTRALDPGLVFKTTTNDYLNFLCYLGYNQRRIRSMSRTNFTCPRNSNEQLVSNINYPTISIGSLNKTERPRMVTRVVTNVGSSRNVTYVCSVKSPPGLVVKVVPKKIVFTDKKRRSSFKVFFDGRQAVNGYNFGDVTWTDGSHLVRSVFAVNVQ